MRKKKPVQAAIDLTKKSFLESKRQSIKKDEEIVELKYALLEGK